MRILYVEDSDVFIRTMQRIANHLGHELLIAETGAQALLHIDSAPDLIFLDMNLPDMNGLELARQIRTRLSQTPIVALTARALAGDLEDCLAAGCSQHVAKPIRVDDLIALIKSYAS